MAALVVVLSAAFVLPGLPARANQPGCGADSLPLITVGSTPPCYEWQGSWKQIDVTVPSRIQAIGAYPGTVLAPEDTVGPGPFPAVAVLHGYQGQKHHMHWLSRYLASRGYVVLAVTAPSSSEHGRPDDYVEAVRSMVDFLVSDVNPERARTDVDHIGAVGHSQGAKGVAGAQAVDRRIDAIVALDNLPADVFTDDGSAVDCGIAGTGRSTRVFPESLPVAPRVPALGLASDLPCAVDPADLNPEQKKHGYRLWRDAGVPAVVVAEADTHHFHFDQGPDDLLDLLFPPFGDDDPTEELFHRFAIQTEAWYARWLRHEPKALGRLLGPDIDAISSTRFLSAAYLPNRQIDCEDLRACPNLARA